jgi:hypothetical protein
LRDNKIAPSGLQPNGTVCKDACRNAAPVMPAS